MSIGIYIIIDKCHFIGVFAEKSGARSHEKAYRAQKIMDGRQ
jgi:hypothetical protein